MAAAAQERRPAKSEAGRQSRPRSGRRPSRRNLQQGPRSSPPIATCCLIRRFEEKAGQIYGMGLIGGFCHLYIGQEAVVVGMQMALEDGDQVITGYRDHGHMLACGMDPRASWPS